MNLTKMAQKQMTLAKTAQQHPEHRFTNLYSLLHWDYWMRCAADTVLARPGSSTAGVDGKTRDYFKNHYEEQIAALVESMKRKTYHPQPAKRVYIPKANSTQQRPLGIPCLKDRVAQAVVKNALEPSWEARFEANSYGFRPGRSCHDAIRQCHNRLQKGTDTWIFDADIRGAFDHISHEFILNRLRQTPGRELIKQWLKAGYVEAEVFHETNSGTPQGGIISPLLANIALDGLDELLATFQKEKKYLYIQLDGRQKVCRKRRNRYGFIRYADDVRRS